MNIWGWIKISGYAEKENTAGPVYGMGWVGLDIFFRMGPLIESLGFPLKATKSGFSFLQPSGKLPLFCFLVCISFIEYRTYLK